MSHPFSRRLRPIITLFLLAVTAHAGLLTNTIDEARTHVRQNLASRSPGFSIAVGHNGKILWSEGFGFADLSTQQPVTPQTQFRIGSVAEPLTAAGLMRLVEQNKINLDADIHEYVPDFPDKGETISTRQLAGHLAGIRHYRGNEFLSNAHYDTVRAGLKIFENDPLLSKPGEKFFYSSYGFNLIGMVAESAAHQNFCDYMQQAVFAPLRMSNTIPEDARFDLSHCTKFYQLGKGKTNFVLTPAVDNSYKWASGGFLSTPEDMVRFGFAMLHPGFLTSVSLDTMFTPQKTTAGKNTGYGIGWVINHDSRGHPVWSHSGGAVGGSSILMVYPDKGLVIAMTANYEDALDKSGLQSIQNDFLDFFKFEPVSPDQ